MEQSEKATLLIIEDHEIVALGLKTLIGSNPALSTVDCATNARQAIQLTVNHPYNLYIIDVELPDMTGIELVRSLKTLSPDSAFRVSDDKQVCRFCPVHAFCLQHP